MLLYTPMPIELVMKDSEKTRNFLEVDYRGTKLIIEPLDMSSGRIVRVMSTDPKDFLNASFKPGKIIKYTL